MNIETNQFNQGKETFYEIFQRTLNNKSSSRPPKIELTGLLVPNHKTLLSDHCKYILETDSKEYFLNMNEANVKIANKMECEEVTVKGYLDLEINVFEVEKISLASEPHRLLTSFPDTYFDLNEYKRIISQRGKLEPALDYLAS